MLQNAMMPFGVEGGTRSRAAERMITYNTTETLPFSSLLSYYSAEVLAIVDQPEHEEREAQFRHELLLSV